MSRRSKYPEWKFVKYKGDLAVYAECSCGFSYRCDKNESKVGVRIAPDIEALYPYCPWCGAEKHSYDDRIQYIEKYRWER